MAIVNIPDMRVIKDFGERLGWSRERMYQEYRKQLTTGNQHILKPTGALKSVGCLMSGLFRGRK